MKLINDILNNDDNLLLDNFNKTSYKFDDSQNIVKLKQISLDKYLKNTHSKDKHKRDKKILKSFQDGYTQGEIASYLGITNSRVFLLLKGC